MNNKKVVFKKEVSESGFETTLIIFSVLTVVSIAFIFGYIFSKDKEFIMRAGYVFIALNIVLFLFVLLAHFAFREVTWVKVK